jgi:YVTN family beta-propeller protein
VSVVDYATNAAVANIPVGDMGGATEGQIAVNPAGTYAFVTNYTSNNLSVISTATHQVVATVPTGSHPIAVSVLPSNGSKVYVLNGGGNTITVIDGAAFTVLNTIAPQIVAGGVVTSLALDPGGAKIYVGVFNTKKASSSIILTVSTVNHATTGGVVVDYPVALGLGPTPGELLTIGAGKNSEGLIPITLGSKMVVVTAGIVPLKIPPVTAPATYGIVAATGGNTAFVTCSGSVFSVNLKALTLNLLASAGSPAALALDPSGAELWVPNSESLGVAVFAASNGTALPSINLSNPSFGIGFAQQ